MDVVLELIPNPRRDMRLLINCFHLRVEESDVIAAKMCVCYITIM